MMIKLMTPIVNFLVPLQNDGGGILGIIAPLAVTVVIFAGFWKTFEKAGEPGWAAIIPIYNFYILTKISDNAWWWVILFFIPVIQVFALAKISIDVAGKFGKGILFGLGLTFLSFIFFPLLGFGGARYQDATQLG
jgi:hypothetical protein